MGIGHRLDPMWDGSNAPELRRGELPDGPWPSEQAGPNNPPEGRPLFCPYCNKLLYPPGNLNKQHACTQTVAMLYNPGTVVFVEAGTWALILQTTQDGLIHYQRFTPVRTDYEEEPIADFHLRVTGEPVTP